MSVMGNNFGGRFRKFGFRNRMVVSVFISIMLVYLVKKNMVNGLVVYFILNFEISFDFFFVRLNGVWLVLVRVEMYYIIVRGYVEKMR